MLSVGPNILNFIQHIYYSYREKIGRKETSIIRDPSDGDFLQFNDVIWNVGLQEVKDKCVWWSVLKIPK